MDLKKGLRYVLLFTTNAPTSEAEEWLDEYCDGAWSLEVDGISEDLTRKRLRISFAREDDKALFKDQFVSGKWKREGPADEEASENDGEDAPDGTYQGPENRIGGERRSGYDRRRSQH